MTSPAHNRKLKKITFDLDGTEYQVQCSAWNIVNNSPEPTKQYTYDPDATFNEEVDPDFSLTASFFADWRSEGISDFTWTHDGETLPFTVDHHPDIPGEHVRWAGQVTIKAPTVGGDVRTTEVTAVEWKCVGKPDFTRP